MSATVSDPAKPRGSARSATAWRPREITTGAAVTRRTPLARRLHVLKPAPFGTDRRGRPGLAVHPAPAAPVVLSRGLPQPRRSPGLRDSAWAGPHCDSSHLRPAGSTLSGRFFVHLLHSSHDDVGPWRCAIGAEPPQLRRRRGFGRLSSASQVVTRTHSSAGARALAGPRPMCPAQRQPASSRSRVPPIRNGSRSLWPRPRRCGSGHLS